MHAVMKTAQVIILALLAYTKGIYCQSANEFIVDDVKLIYFDQNLTWNEASSLCRSEGSSLVTITKPLFALHMLEAVAAFQAQGLVWIGGRLIRNEWVWKVSGLPIQFEKENLPLPFAGSNNTNLTNYKCLAISTQNFPNPTFFSANCSESKGLLCEKAQQQPTLLVEEFTYNNHNYTIYEGHSTWETAVGICNKRNMYLAILSSVTELQEVALTLASFTHLDINIVWVGGLRDQNFEWVTTGDHIEHTIHNDTKLSNCLTLNIKNQLLYAANCSNGFAFVCESKHLDDDYWESFVHQSNEYTVHSLKTTWEKANQICEADNSYLATVDDLLAANAIAVNMQNSWESLSTIWLGAKTVYIKSKWLYKWQGLNVELPGKANSKGYPPWKNSQFERNKNSCLILEQSGSNVYFSNSACDNVHGFICQRDSSVPLAITLNFKVGDRDLLFHDKPETWFKAQQICELAYSRLLIVSDPDDLFSIKKFTTRHKLWLDGIYEDKWQWKHETEDSPTENGHYALPDVSNSSGETCLAIQLEKSRPKFVATLCKRKLPYICERNSQKEQLIKYKGNEYTIINKHLTWHEASAVCRARDQNLAATCDINEVEFLSKFTITYGNLWLGAIKRETKWIWDAIQVTLAHKADRKIGYPPWLNGKAKRKEISCLTLTLNASSHAAFTDTSCKEIKSFVCEKYSVQSHRHKFLEPRVTVLDDRQYIFYPHLSTWKDASEECSDNLAFLAIVSTQQIARDIANLTYGYPEIWIGGYLDGDSWKWLINGENIKDWTENETQWATENEINEDIVLKGQYLALNRLNPNIPLFVEKYGNEKLGFVCERANNIEEDEYLTERVPFNGGELLFVENKLNYTDAHDFCKSNDGILVIANTPNILQIIAARAKKYHGAWLGATLTIQSRKFLWTYIRSEVIQEIYLNVSDLLRVKRSADTFEAPTEEIDPLKSELDSFAYGPTRVRKSQLKCENETEEEPSYKIIQEDESNNTNEYEDYTSYSADDADNDGIIESWEVDTDKADHNGHASYEDYDFLNLNGDRNLKRVAKSHKSGRRHTLNKKKPENLADVAVTLPDSYTTKAKHDKFTTDDQETTSTTKIPMLKVKLTVTTDRNPLTDSLKSFKSTDRTTQPTESSHFSTTESDFITTKNDLVLTETESSLLTMNTITEETTDSTESLIEQNNSTLQNLVYCLKTDEFGRLMALNCSSRQSFVCEIRTSQTNENVTEEFSVGNITYVVSNQRLSWKKAYKKCNKTYGGYLAILKDIEEINFITNVSKDFQDLWIGAKYEKEWEWPYINQNMLLNDSLWSSDNRLYNCANVYRQHSKKLMLVDRNCSEKHGFICKDAKPRIASMETINGYTIHWRHATFFQALQICAKHGTILATAANNEQILDILNLQKGLHSSWISAFYLDDKWMLLNSNIEVKNLNYTSGRECLSIFKHSSSNYSFVDRNCDMYLPFVCENANNRTLTFNNKTYTFYLKSVNWLQASKYCASEGQQLAIIQNEQTAHFIQTLVLVFGEVWVGAKLENGSRWIWDFTKEILNEDPATHMPIHKPTQHILDVNSNFCVYAHSFKITPVLLNKALCTEPKGFVCQGVSSNDVPPVQSLMVNDRVYTLYVKLSTWLEAWDTCNSNGTYLVILDTVEEIHALGNFTLSTFWTGGLHEDTWIWNHTGQDIPKEMLPHHKKRKRGFKNCLSFYKDGLNLDLLNLDCSMQLPFVCEEVGHNSKPQTRRLDFENEYLILHSLPLTWDEARVMCQSAGQHLASITDENVEHFLKLPPEYHDLWIDGKNEDDIWVWMELDAEIPTSYTLTVNNSNISLNSFIRTSVRPNHTCLSLYHPDTKSFAFLDSNCNDRLGFICQGTKYMQNQIKTIIVGGREYSIYTKKATWAQANKICKSNGTYLAVLNTTEEIELLTQSSIHFVKLWTGAVNREGNWIWDHTGAQISINNYTKHLKSASQCGVIKKSNQGSVALLSKNCTMLYAFVCEERGDQGKWTSKVLNISGRYYSIFSERAIWSHASDMCTERGQYLALVDTEGEMEIINHLDADFHDLWIGARRTENSDTWIWKHTGREFSLNELVQNYPKFINKTFKNNCLNIYREWNADSLFIDRDCNEQHGYICEGVPISNEHPEVLKVAFNGHKYILIQQQLPWKGAYRACNKFNGYLAIISSQEEADFLSSLNGAFHDLWIGGQKLNNTVWKWYLTGQNISKDNIIWERAKTHEDHNCLNLYSADGQSGIFMDRKCLEKHSFVCEETHLYKQIGELDYSDLKDFDDFNDMIFPNDFVPYFVDYKGKRYMFANVPVDFDTARDSCRQKFGYLLIIDDEAEREFIGNNTQGYHNLWIDAKRQNNTWIWEHLGTAVAPDNFINYPGRNGHDCLLFYRHDNVTSYYIDRKCQEKHGFVCKDVNEHRVGVEFEFTYKERFYLLVPTSSLTWFEAEEYCRAQGAYLSVVDSTDEAQFLASLGNDLWINGKFDKEMNIWTWYHTGQEVIFSNYNVSKYTPTLEDHDNVKCLNLYRSFNYTPNFVERNCTDKFSFVCEDLVDLTYDVRNISKENNGRKYLFVNQKVTWQDAYDICRNNGSYLAIVSTQEEGRFISKMANAFHDMWIDGKFVTNSWISTYTGQSLETKRSNENSSSDLIEWASSEKRSGFNCFNVYLPSSSALLFVDRNCSEKHTFVCEEVVDRKASLVKTIEYAGTRYSINMEAVTWEEAYKRCSKHGYLAIIDSVDEAAMLERLSGEFHSLWIGARYDKEQWSWNYTGELVEQDYTLWVDLVPQNHSDCAILYRDNFLAPFIVEKSCGDKFGYICEEGETLQNPESRKAIEHEGKIYTFYQNPLSWDAARNYCEKAKAALAVVEKPELAALLMQQKNYYHVWIDGFSEGVSWIWSSTGVHLTFDNSAINYIRAIPRYPQSCLSLFRSNKTVSYLDEECNVAKPFVCQNYDRILTGNVTSVRRNSTRYYLINDVKKTWFEAWETCAANGSYLPIVKDEVTANFISSLYPAPKGEIWLGARKFSGWWTWDLTEEPLIEGESETEFPVWERLNQPDNMCLGLDHQITMHPVFADISCSSAKLVVCEQGCVALPEVNGTWDRLQCKSRVQKVGEECKVNCTPGFLHTGRSDITCSLNGWNDNIPICTNIRDFSLSIVSNVKDALNEQKIKATSKERRNVGLLFLIDTSHGIKWENYEIILEIVKSISVGVRSLNDTVLHGIISFEAEAVVEINFVEIDTCSFIQKVDKLAYRSISDIVSYVKTFETAQNLMQNASLDGNSVLVIVTGSNTTENLDHDLLGLKQKGNIIFVIGIKPHVDINLIQQLASPESSKHHISVDYFELDEIAYVLNRTFLYSGKLACCMRLRNTNAVSVSPTSCTRDVSLKNAKCSIHCNNDHQLQGMESLMCTSEGWQSTLELQRPFPECYSVQRVTRKFVKMIQALYNNKVVDSTLFLIDQSGSMMEDDFLTELKFVKYVFRMGLSKVGTIIFSSEAYVVIPLNNYEDPDYICTLYDKLDSASFSGGSTNYEKAFAAASKQIEFYMKHSSNSEKHTLIVMLTDGQTSETVESAEKLKALGHTIAVVSIAVDRRRNLIKMVSNDVDNAPMLFSLNTFMDLDDMVTEISNELKLQDVVFCCKLPAEFQKQYLKMFIMQSENVQVTCSPGYSLSIENNTLKCTEIGLNPIPTCFAVPKKIAEYVSSQFAHIFSQFSRVNKNKNQKQVIVFLIDQTETMTSVKNKQAVAFVKSVTNLLQLSENRTVGLINGQNHEAVMLIEPNVICPIYFSELLTNITFNSTSYSMYKPLKYILEKLITPNVNVLTVIISDRSFISTPSLKLAHKILSTNSNIYVMDIHNETTDSNIANLVNDRNDMFISGYYLLKNNLYTVDSFETLEAVAENLNA